ncbi:MULTISPECIES: IucA/IucC family protein [unclassified Paenibacillus]|uniref:IucA/IucC family protein n=1 Tax=unclassified Paenibacillus TaxID=185978 RepID=UPI002117D353|nr:MULTISPECIES: IucA/IucC family protein [unclassified Paenibacillus]
MTTEHKGPDSRAHSKEAADEADCRVMEDLVNALLAETFFDEHDEVNLLSQTEWEFMVRGHMGLAAADRQFGSLHPKASVYCWRLDDYHEAMIVFPVHPAILQPYRFEASAGMYEVRIEENHTVYLKKLDPLGLMRHIVHLYGKDPAAIDAGGADRFMNMLDQTLLQMSWSLENKQPSAGILGLPSAASLLELERKAAFRDRPFHPVSKVKLGWTQEDYRNYTAEFARPIQLNWMAVKRRYLVSGLDEHSIEDQYKQAETGGVAPADLLLAEDQKAGIREEMDRRGLSTEEFVPVPVHPWQMSTVLPGQLQEEIGKGICIPLNVEAGTFYATSSLRSLMPANGGQLHVKLPLGMHSLGGLRYLSAIKLMNGQRAERLMRQALERDPVLKKRLLLCDETVWWAYLPENRDLFADPPRHLSAMIRQYPPEITDHEHVRLVPMSSLTVFDRDRKGHLFDEWLRMTGLEVNESSVLRLFKEALLPYFEICFRLFRLGMMPEVHGQNSILILNRGKIEGLLLRDHDALRLHVPWLNANGLEDPEYRLRPGHPNSLYHDTPHQLFSFFQMLGIQVNSYAILDSLSRYYGIKEERLWIELQECLNLAMIEANVPDEVRCVLEECLFARERWPWKQIIRPLLKPNSRVPGSMPFGLGEAPNPFKVCAGAIETSV